MLTTICPHCEGVSVRQTPVGHEADEPKSGDLSLCDGCGEISVFDAASPTGLRLPTEEEHTHFADCPQISEARATITLRSLR